MSMYLLKTRRKGKIRYGYTTSIQGVRRAKSRGNRMHLKVLARKINKV